MAQVDPENDNIQRFIVRHYRYDPERRERRHVVVAAFDNEPQFQACMQEVGAEIRRRRDSNAWSCPSNTSYVTAVRDETVDESQTVQELTPRGSSASTPA